MKTKIVFVIGATKSGGAEKRAILISKLLSTDFDTKVFAFHGEKIDGVDFVFKNSYSEYKKNGYKKRIKSLQDYLLLENPTFVFSFVPHINLMTTLALKCKKLNDVKHVLCMVHYTFNFFNMRLLKFSLKRADYVYYQTKQQKDLVGCKCDSFILPNPIANYDCDENIVRNNFISTGRLEEQKDYEFMIKSFKFVCDKYKNERLDIFGNGSQKEYLQKLINELNLADDIIIHPYTDKIFEEYNKHKYFVFTSKREGFPNTLAEAMKCELVPFVTEFKTGCDELIIDGKTGFKCIKTSPEEFANMIIKGIDNEGMIKEISTNAKKHVEELCSQDKFRDNLTNILNNYLKQK